MYHQVLKNIKVHWFNSPSFLNIIQSLFGSDISNWLLCSFHPTIEVKSMFLIKKYLIQLIKFMLGLSGVKGRFYLVIIRIIGLPPIGFWISVTVGFVLKITFYCCVNFIWTVKFKVCFWWKGSLLSPLSFCLGCKVTHWVKPSLFMKIRYTFFSSYRLCLNLEFFKWLAKGSIRNPFVVNFK